ncbi:hypothetical protein BKA93DRAFT_751072 [Sparassis latifolia]
MQAASVHLKFWWFTSLFLALDGAGLRCLCGSDTDVITYDEHPRWKNHHVVVRYRDLATDTTCCTYYALHEMDMDSPAQSASSHERTGSIDYQWTSLSSGILDLYVESTSKEDTELFQKWKANMDNLLMFAGLFSTVVTGFAVASYPTLEQDSGTVVMQLLQQILVTLQENTGEDMLLLLRSSSASASFHPTTSAIFVNKCLREFLRNLNAAVASLATCFIDFTLTVYAITVILPFIFTACPFKTSLVSIFYGTARNLVSVAITLLDFTWVNFLYSLSVTYSVEPLMVIMIYCSKQLGFQDVEDRMARMQQMLSSRPRFRYGFVIPFFRWMWRCLSSISARQVDLIRVDSDPLDAEVLSRLLGHAGPADMKMLVEDSCKFREQSKHWPFLVDMLVVMATEESATSRWDAFRAIRSTSAGMSFPYDIQEPDYIEDLATTVKAFCHDADGWCHCGQQCLGDFYRSLTATQEAFAGISGDAHIAIIHMIIYAAINAASAEEFSNPSSDLYSNLAIRSLEVLAHITLVQSKGMDNPQGSRVRVSEGKGRGMDFQTLVPLEGITTYKALKIKEEGYKPQT